MEQKRTAADNPLIAAGKNWPVHFYVPKAAARVLDQLAIRDKARDAGVQGNCRFELSEFRTPPSRARITSDAQLTPFIVEAWQAMLETARGDQLLAIGEAITAALDALEPTAKPRRP